MPILNGMQGWNHRLLTSVKVVASSLIQGDGISEQNILKEPSWMIALGVKKGANAA